MHRLQDGLHVGLSLSGVLGKTPEKTPGKFCVKGEDSMQYEKLKRLKELYTSLMQELDGVTEHEVLSLYEDATVNLALCDFLAFVMDLRNVLQGMDGDRNIDLFLKLGTALVRAEKLHPVFAEGVYQGIGRLSEEMGEISRAANRGESIERLESEAMDMLVVAWRFARKDYEQHFNCDEIEAGGQEVSNDS